MFEERIVDDFNSIFPGSADPQIFRAPGRVNLIGEHTDYNMGFVCPIALGLACFVATAPNSGGVLRIYSGYRRQMREWAVKDLPDCQPAGDWTDYIIGVAQQLLRLNYSVAPLNLYVSSTVPVGSGLSSSAALTASAALALLGERPMPPLEIALLGRRAENEFVGTPCGIMDQYVSVFGREHAALKIDCRDLSHVDVPIPESVEILAVNTMVKHELGQSAYRERVRECCSALEALHKRYPGLQSLRNANADMVDGLSEDTPDPLLRRARHVVSENLRVSQFVEACTRNDLQRMGTLFVESHNSLQHDYEVSCEQLDFLVDAALKLSGVWGARMTGGGFGGCTVNLVDPEYAGRFREGISAAYQDRYRTVPEIYGCIPSEGAGRI